MENDMPKMPLRIAVALISLTMLAAGPAPASAGDLFIFPNRTNVQRPVPPEAFAILAMSAKSKKVASAQCDLYVQLTEPGGGHGIIGRLMIESKAHGSCMTLKGY
jgi:hypothetical protein